MTIYKGNKLGLWFFAAVHGDTNKCWALAEDRASVAPPSHRSPGSSFRVLGTAWKANPVKSGGALRSGSRSSKRLGGSNGGAKLRLSRQRTVAEHIQTPCG